MGNIISTKLCPVLNAKIMSQSKEEIPVIIQLKEDNQALLKELSVLSNKVKYNFPLIQGFAGYISTEMISQLSNNSNVEYISFDSQVYTLLDIAAPSIQAYFPHEEGYEGEGITIATVDTGISPHSDLTKPSNRIINFKDFINNKTEPYDDNGHGTHVAGIIAGNGFSSNGTYLGIAPKANILAVKALDKDGGGSTSNIIEAISYIIETKNKYNTRILNLSIGTPATIPCKNDPLCKVVDKAIKAGLIVIVAAGNSGPKKGTILSPGNSMNAITVGAVDDKRTIDTSDDTIAPFCSRGPTKEGLIKPDLLAPGVNINSLSNVNLYGYSSLSGTSMATPLVSGAAALLLNKDNTLTSNEVKEMLMNSTIDFQDSKDLQGIGLLNLRKLFNKEEERETNNIPHKPKESKGDLYETLIIVLIILFLLDSKV